MTEQFNIEDFNSEKSPKYSPNLYKWMKSQEAQPLIVHGLKVYKDKENHLWIGLIDDEFPGDFLGCRLAGVLCNGRKERMGWLLGFVDQLTECAEFWSEYKQDGRCAIDREHQMFFVRDKTRWQQEGNVRRCLWCGKMKQQLHAWTETVHRQTWKTQP